ncbi:hypothetical protein GCM10027161_73150 [Microbispora hainanensis]
MSRSRARDPRDTKVPAGGRSTRRLVVAALVIAAAGVVAAQPAMARVAPHHPRAKLSVARTPGPGGGGGQLSRRGRTGGGQVIKGGRAGGGQGQSGAGHYNQNLTGVISPAFVRGQAQQAITDHGRFDVESGFCGTDPELCSITQDMPIRHGS